MTKKRAQTGAGHQMILSGRALGLTVASVVVLAGCGSNNVSTATSTGDSSPPGGGSSAPAPPPSSGHSKSSTPSAAATEFSPPGDIPDNQVFVDYASGHVHLQVPEGWGRSSKGGVTTFTDKYNSISLQVVPKVGPPTVASARRTDVAVLQASQAKFALHQVSTIQRQHGTAVLITYQLDSAPSAVTGKVIRDAAQRYEFWQHGHEAVLTLTGPQNADNVDPWRLVSDSLQWR